MSGIMWSYIPGTPWVPDSIGWILLGAPIFILVTINWEFLVKGRQQVNSGCEPRGSVAYS